MRYRFDEEHGVAMATAVLATLAVLLLTAVAVGFSIRSSQTSAQNRERIQGIAAADAGIDFYFSHLTDARENTVDCSPPPEDMTTSPPATFTVTVTFSDAAGTINCDPVTGLERTPTNALIRSVGTVGGQGIAGTDRTMEALVTLRRIQGTLGFAPFAVFADGSLDLDSNTQIIGSQGNNADVHVNGDVKLDSNTLVSGSVFATGTITMSSNSEIKVDAYSDGDLSMVTNTIIRGNGTSGSGKIDLKGSAHIFGDATACTDVVRSPQSRIDGDTTIADDPGDCLGPPPAHEFPTVTFVPANWEADGFTVETFTGSNPCAAAKTFLNSVSADPSLADDYVVVISGPDAKCNLGWTSSTVNVRGRLAIFSDGEMSLGGNFRMQPVGGPYDMFFFLGRTPGSPCGFEMVSNARIEAGLPVLIHTPCTIRLRANSSVAEGQFFGNDVEFDSNSGFLNFVALEIPGEPSPGWEVDVQYKREVPSS